jgi:RHS repeat-associated protein
VVEITKKPWRFRNSSFLLKRRLHPDLTADPSDRTDYTWDHRNRLIEVETSGEEQSLVQYRYDAQDGLVWRQANIDGLNVQTEQYNLAAGRRTLTLDASGLPPGSPGTLAHRYQYGPTGEAIYDQAFSSLGQATSLLEPLGDHQNSTRVILGHASNDVGATSVRQSIDYAPFGSITAIKDSSGQSTTAALDTVFGHHGSLTDGATGLQLKGARWYSPDLGRFLSEDPIHDGTNWYEAFGNDPVNFADPTGLSQTGYPLATYSSPLNGSYGGVFNTPSINLSLPSYSPTTSTFGGFVGAGPGSSILGGGLAYAAPVSRPANPAFTPGSIGNFHCSIDASNNLNSLLSSPQPGSFHSAHPSKLNSRRSPRASAP